MKRSYDNSIRLQNKTKDIATYSKQMVYPEQSKNQNAAKPYFPQNQQNPQLSHQTLQINLNGVPQHPFSQVHNNVYSGQQYMQHPQQQQMVLQVPNNLAGNCQQLIQMRQPSPCEPNPILTQIITPQGNFMVPSVYTRMPQNVATNNNFLPQYYTISNFQQPYLINNAAQSPYNMVHNQSKSTPSTYQTVQQTQQQLQEEVRKIPVSNSSNSARVNLLENVLVNKVNTQTSDAFNREMVAKSRNSLVQSTATNMTSSFNVLSGPQNAQNIIGNYPQVINCLTSNMSNEPAQANVASIHDGNELLGNLTQPVQNNAAQNIQPLTSIMPNSSIMTPSEDVHMPVSNMRGDTEASITSTVTCGPPVEVMQNPLLQQQFVQIDQMQQAGQSIVAIAPVSAPNEYKEDKIPSALKSNFVEVALSTESAVPEEEVSRPKVDVVKEESSIAVIPNESNLVVEELVIVQEVVVSNAPVVKQEAKVKESAESKSVKAAVQQRQDLLTHVIEGVVIQESSLPFPIRVPPKKIEPEVSTEKFAAVHVKSEKTSQPADYPKAHLVKPQKNTGFATEKNNNVIDKLNSGHTRRIGTMSKNRVTEGNKCEDQDIEIFEDKLEIKQKKNNMCDLPKKQSRNSDIIMKAGNVPKKVKRCEAQDWSVEEVYKFVKSIPGCEIYADDFADQEIDGEALFLIKADHLMDNLAMKLGPALKVLASIQDLRPKEEALLSSPYDNEVFLK